MQPLTLIAILIALIIAALIIRKIMRRTVPLEQVTESRALIKRY